MSIARNTLLWMSENTWMKRNVPKWWFVKKAVKKFMPGESDEDALRSASEFKEASINTVLTKLGENITSLSEAAEVRNHYIWLVDKIKARGLDVEISLKLTQLGFDFSFDETLFYFGNIAEKVKRELGNTLFIDMEGSAYTQKTLDFYKKTRELFGNTGICLQAYLYRTENDINELVKNKESIRLVKGAYKEPVSISFASKADVDKNYFLLATKLMEATKRNGTRAIFATHDELLIRKIIAASKESGLDSEQLEFQMLYGIKPAFQKKLAAEGYKVRVLIAYGSSWYPWYMRRLAERPANIWFVLKNLFG